MHVIHRHVKTISRVQTQAMVAITANVRFLTMELTANMVNDVLFHFYKAVLLMKDRCKNRSYVCTLYWKSLTAAYCGSHIANLENVA